MCGSNLDDVTTCTNGSWSTSACPQYSVCVKGGCQPVCDGYLSTQTLASACLFPVNENGHQGTFYYTNDPSVFQYPNTFGASVGHGSQDAAIAASSAGASWPYAWKLMASDQAVAAFTTQGFPGIVTDASYYFDAKKLLTGWAFKVDSASGSTTFGTASISAGTGSWELHGASVGSLSSNFSNTAWNSMFLRGQTSGPTPTGIIAELDWYMLEISTGAYQ